MAYIRLEIDRPNVRVQRRIDRRLQEKQKSQFLVFELKNSRRDFFDKLLGVLDCAPLCASLQNRLFVLHRGARPSDNFVKMTKTTEANVILIQATVSHAGRLDGHVVIRVLVHTRSFLNVLLLSVEAVIHSIITGNGSGIFGFFLTSGAKIKRNVLTDRVAARVPY